MKGGYSYRWSNGLNFNSPRVGHRSVPHLGHRSNPQLSTTLFSIKLVVSAPRHHRGNGRDAFVAAAPLLRDVKNACSLHALKQRHQPVSMSCWVHEAGRSGQEWYWQSIFCTRAKSLTVIGLQALFAQSVDGHRAQALRHIVFRGL
jgi:hypothetical protein